MTERGGYLKGREDKMGDISNTQFFRAVQEEKKLEASQVLEQVYTALTEKGYNPINQIVDILCLEIRPILPATRVPEA